MQHISATQLRTKMPELIETIRQGGSVDLLYRSQVLAEIRPKVNDEKVSKKMPLSYFLKSISKSKKTTPEERDRIYRKHLMEKYG